MQLLQGVKPGQLAMQTMVEELMNLCTRCSYYHRFNTSKHGDTPVQQQSGMHMFNERD